MASARTLGFQLAYALYIFGAMLLHVARALVKAEGETQLPIPINWQSALIVFAVLIVLEFIFAFIETPVPKEG